ncbi:MAG: S-layer homology domain-containing protein [Firmicutes bacterium]|nr:S-layer homology domain-containing protein [Bacillota bacterium]
MAKVIHAQNPNITNEQLGNVIGFISGGEVPVNLEDEDYIPQIIKFDMVNNTTEVIYRPQTIQGDDGKLYYTDKDGNMVPQADVSSETASFRSVVEFNGNLYFGSLGVNMLQLVRINENDEADVVYQTIASASSLRAGCIYDDGDGDTVYFGGQDATYRTWRAYLQAHAGEPRPLPIVIRRLDPQTAGSEQEDWNGVVADFRDFGEYAYASVYVSGGGNVWDLCSYNGKLYLILAYDEGWAMFRGEKGGDAPNDFGWTWTEIVGDQGKYPLAMDEEVGRLNRQYAKEYGCSEFAPMLNGTGLLESTATPYIYNDKMYIGTFDNATMIQTQTVVKALAKLQALMNYEESGSTGPTLAQIFAPIYEVLTHPQHIWVMDEEENITAVSEANALLDGTTNDYVWRFIEHDGKLYAGTFDSATAYTYFLNFPLPNLGNLLEKNGFVIPDEVQSLLNGDSILLPATGKANRLLAAEPLLAVSEEPLLAVSEETQEAEALLAAATDAFNCLNAFQNNEADVEDLLQEMTALAGAREEFAENNSKKASPARRGAGPLEALPVNDSLIPQDMLDNIDWLLQTIDIEGLRYWAAAREIVNRAGSGFDILVSEDGDTWERIVDDGLRDPYNYGARTFTEYDGEVYVGTANPYYGAQLWQISEAEDADDYSITVINGVADAERAAAGDTVTVTADRISGYTFRSWQVLSGDVTLADSTARTTTFVMPAGNVTLMATYTKNSYGGSSDSQDDSHIHTYGDWRSDANYHWKECRDNDGAVKDKAAHVDADKDNKCDVCGYAMGDGEHACTLPFTDVKPTDWFHDDVHYVFENGLMEGIHATQFAPNAYTTRAMIVTILYRLENQPAVSGTNPFRDVAEGQWYAKAIAWAQQHDIVKGYSATEFGPNDNITREQMAAILYRYAQYKGKGFSGAWMFRLDYEDADSISQYANEAMHWCVMNGLMEGVGNGRLDPQGKATRAQVAAILHRFCENIK